MSKLYYFTFAINVRQFNATVSMAMNISNTHVFTAHQMSCNCQTAERTPGLGRCTPGPLQAGLSIFEVRPRNIHSDLNYIYRPIAVFWKMIVNIGVEFDWCISLYFYCYIRYRIKLA